MNRPHPSGPDSPLNVKPPTSTGPGMPPQQGIYAPMSDVERAGVVPPPSCPRCGESPMFRSVVHGCCEQIEAVRALHYEFAEDNCCDPVQYSDDCDYIQICHECGQAWPCDTVRVMQGEAALVPPRRPASLTGGSAPLADRQPEDPAHTAEVRDV